MSQYAKLRQLTEENAGILQTSKALEAGISKPTVAEFVKRNAFEKVAHGIYCSPDFFPDPMYVLQQRCPQIIFSHGTAMYLQDMTVRDPLHFSVTVKTGYNPTHLKEDGVKAYTIKKELYPVGITEVETEYGHKVQAYNPERCLCDMIRSRKTVDIQVFQDGLRHYIREGSRNISLLMQYAEMFHVKKRMNLYLEALL